MVKKEYFLKRLGKKSGCCTRRNWLRVTIYYTLVEISTKLDQALMLPPVTPTKMPEKFRILRNVIQSLFVLLDYLQDFPCSIQAFLFY